MSNLVDMRTQRLYPTGSEGFRGQAAHTAMRWWVEEEHLTNHHLRQWSQGRQAKRLQLFRGRCAIGQEALKHCDDIRVTCNDPGMQVRIPVNRILASQPVIQRVRIGKDL